MKKIFQYVSVPFQGNILTIAYGVKHHGYFGIQIYPTLGSTPVKSGEIKSTLRQIVRTLNLPISFYSRSKREKTTTELGKEVMKMIKVGC